MHNKSCGPRLALLDTFRVMFLEISIALFEVGITFVEIAILPLPAVRRAYCCVFLALPRGRKCYNRRKKR